MAADAAAAAASSATRLVKVEGASASNGRASSAATRPQLSPLGLHIAGIQRQ
jgi:hypothetical protein